MFVYCVWKKIKNVLPVISWVRSVAYGVVLIGTINIENSHNDNNVFITTCPVYTQVYELYDMMN